MTKCSCSFSMTNLQWLQRWYGEEGVGSEHTACCTPCLIIQRIQTRSEEYDSASWWAVVVWVTAENGPIKKNWWLGGKNSSTVIPREDRLTGTDKLVKAWRWSYNENYRVIKCICQHPSEMWYWRPLHEVLFKTDCQCEKQNLISGH